MIKPTIGRVVWFWPQKSPDEPRPAQANAALVTYVWGDRMVNLTVFDANGNQRPETSVTLLQDGDAPNPYGREASWMPYQVGQAAKTEQVTSAVKAVADLAAKQGF